MKNIRTGKHFTVRDLRAEGTINFTTGTVANRHVRFRINKKAVIGLGDVIVSKTEYYWVANIVNRFNQEDQFLYAYAIEDNLAILQALEAAKLERADDRLEAFQAWKRISVDPLML